MLSTSFVSQFSSLLTPAWMPSGAEWIVILVIGLLLFGRKLPEIGRSLGQGIRQFKSGLNEVADQAIPSNQQPNPAYPQPPLPQGVVQTGAQPAINPNQPVPPPPPGYPYYYPPPGYYAPQPGQPMLGPDGRPLPPPPPGYGYFPLPPQPQAPAAAPNNQSGPWAAQPPQASQAPGSNSSQRM